MNSPQDIHSVGGEVSADVVTRTTRVSASYSHSRPLDARPAAYAGRALADGAGAGSSWKVFSPNQIKLGVTQALFRERLELSLAAAFFAKVHDPAWTAGQRHRLIAHAAAKLHLSPGVYAKLILQNLTGNTIPAARIDNDLTQVGNLGVEQRLLYVVVGLQTN